jgi:YbbR domain-containing protein
MFGKTYHWLRSNLGSLVLALALALTVWVIATLEENPTIEDDFRTGIGIDVEGLGTGLVITNDYTKTTRVRLRAQEDTWRVISADDIRAVADLSGLGPGIHQVDLHIVLAVPQARLISANPDNIRIELEEWGEREFPVRLSLEGQPAIGYTIDATHLDPSDVTVRGPLSLVDLVSEVRATTSVEGKRDSLREEIPLLAFDNEGNQVDGVTVTPSTATVEVPIKQVAGYRYVSIIPRTTGRVAPGYYVSNVTVTPAQIVLRGSPEVMDSMQPFVETFIDVTGLTDDVIQEVVLNLPAGVTPVDQQPIEALVSIAAQPGSRALLVPVEVIGLDEKFSAKLVPDEVEVILSGPLPMLDALDLGKDITITLDVTGLTIGTYQIEPQVAVQQEEILVESVFPTLIEVTITRSISSPGQ